MAFDRKYIKHLDVMADLTNATPAPSYEVNIKELLTSDTVKKAGIDEKILSLCAKLRQEGFAKQADGLESKFLSYKSASVHLYNTHNETGEDLVNAAHPDGDNSICDAGEGLGDVETILSRHKKMVDVINKEPRGKFASKLNKRADVVIADIGKKFKYMADYIQTHALTNVPEGESLSPEQRDFYGAVALWHQVANLIATELNSPASLPERDAIQLVKNRLQNDRSILINKHAKEINSMEDIDQLINKVLSSIEDRNPNKMASLSSYINECKNILYKEAGGELITTLIGGPIAGAGHVIYNIWQSLKSIFGDVADSAEIMKDAVAELLKDKDTQRFTALKQTLQNTTLPNLNIAINSTQLVKDLELNPKSKLSQIVQYKEFYTALQSHLIDLKTEIVKDQELFRAQQSASSKAYNAVYNVFIMSNANKVRSAATALNSVLADAILLLGQAETESQMNAPGGTTQTNSLLKPLFNDTASNPTVDSAIAQLNGWSAAISKHPTLTPAQKQTGIDFIQKHIVDFQNNKNDPKKIQELVDENKKFQQAWRL